MADLQDTLNLASKLEEATPVEAPQEAPQVNLSSSYLSSNWTDAKSNAFLNDATIETQISSATAASEETKQQAEAAGLNVETYDPTAEQKAQAEAEARAKQLAQEQERAKIREEQKEKIALFLKWENSKNRKAWYLRGVLSWVALTLGIIVLTVIFAKEQVVDFISKDISSFLWQKQNISASVIELTNEEDVVDEETVVEEEEVSDEETIVEEEEVSDEENLTENNDEELPFFSNPEITDDKLASDEENSSDEKKVSDEENLTENNDEELPFFSNPEITDDKLTSDEENSSDKEKVSDEENVVGEESEIIEKPSTPNYIVTHVNSPEQANWVMSANCSELACGDYTKATGDLPLCKDFKPRENLKDDSKNTTVPIMSTLCFKYLFIHLFVFGCAGSSLLHVGFL